MSAPTENETTWTREIVEAMVALGGVQRWARDDGGYPVIEWCDSSATHWVSVMGYLEPTNGIWHWMVEAGNGPESQGTFLERYEADDQDAVMDATADLLNRFSR